MGFVSRAMKPKISAAMSPTDDRWYYPGGAFYGGVATLAGVDNESALRLLTVYTCVKVLYESIAQLPCHLMEKIGREKQHAVDHPLYRVLHDQPNAWMTSCEFWGMVIANIALRGNFYAFKAYLPGRPVRALIPVSEARVKDIIQNSDMSLTYKISPRDCIGPIKDYSQQDIFHVRGIHTDGFKGINPITQAARDAIGLGRASDEFLLRYFSKGMHPGAIIKHPLKLNAPEHSNARKELKEKYSGLGKSHEFMLLDEGMDITFPTIKLVDAQYLELSKMNQAQICGLFRIPLMLIQAGDAPTTYASSEQFMLAFVNHALAPIVTNIEKAIYRDLLTEEEKKRYFAKFNMNALLRGDIKSRFEAYQIGVNAEILCPNEARDWEELNPYSGGDEFRTRTSTVKEPAKSNEVKE